MAWTAPRTWTTGELVTAAFLNTHVRDNLNETAPAKAAVAGDLFYATAANTITKLAVGADGRYLKSSGSVPYWDNVDNAGAYHSTALVEIADNTWTTLAWDAEDWDKGSLHNTATNNSRMTLGVGIWIIQTAIAFVANATGRRGLRFRIGGALGTTKGGLIVPAVNGYVTGLNITTFIGVGTPTYVEAQVYQNSGAGLNVDYNEGNAGKAFFHVSHLSFTA